MRIRLILKPGSKGTKKLLTKYGARLVCVRYRYDKKKSMSYKTVELIVSARPWHYRPRANRSKEQMKKEG